MSNVLSPQELKSKRGDVSAGWSNACFVCIGSERLFLYNTLSTSWDTFEDKMVRVVKARDSFNNPAYSA